MNALRQLSHLHTKMVNIRYIFRPGQTMEEEQVVKILYVYKNNTVKVHSLDKDQTFVCPIKKLYQLHGN